MEKPLSLVKIWNDTIYVKMLCKLRTMAGEGTGWMDCEIKSLKYLESKGERNKEIKVKVTEMK